MTVSFKKWISLETKKSACFEAVESDNFPDKVFDYLSTALDIPVKRLEKKPWEYTVLSLAETSRKFAPDYSLPLLQGAPKEEKKVDWEYEGRKWNYFSHVLARAYGWTLEYIGNLDVNEALGHIQEIFTEEQLEHEFYHSLSEIAYKYDKSTKKSNYVPMKRPYWMRPVVKEIKKIKMKRSLLPVGYGVDASGLPAEYGTQKIIAQSNS